MPETEVAEAAATTDEGAASAASDAAAPTDDYATLQKRYAGTHRALTDAQKKAEAAEAARTALAAQVDELSRWKAEREQADMTEYERLQAQLKQRESDLAAAKAEAQRERLARRFPLATELLGDDPLPSEEKLAALEERLSAATPAPAESEPEPVVDMNRPKKAIAPATEERTPEALAKRLRDATPAFLADLETSGIKF